MTNRVRPGRYPDPIMVTRGVPQAATFAFDVTSRSIDEQFRRVDTLDSKAGTLLAADGIIAGLIFGRGWLPQETPVAIALAAGVAVLVSLAAALVAFSNRNYQIAPAPEAVTALANAPEDWIRWRLIGNMLAAVDINRVKLRQKARWLTFGQLVLLVGLGLLGGYFVYASLAGGA